MTPSHPPVQLPVLWVWWGGCWRLVPLFKLELLCWILQTAAGPGTAGWMAGLAWSYLAEH